MQILENGTQVPTNGDPYNLTDDLAEMGITAGSVYKVASAAARDALTTVTAGSVVSRTDLPSAPLETFDGTNWSLSDVPWTNVPLAQGFEHWTQNGWSGLKYAVRNGWIIVNGAVYRADPWPADFTCAVIPAAYRPDILVQGTNNAQCEPNAGNIGPGPAGSGAISFSITWPLF